MGTSPTSGSPEKPYAHTAASSRGTGDGRDTGGAGDGYRPHGAGGARGADGRDKRAHVRHRHHASRARGRLTAGAGGGLGTALLHRGRWPLVETDASPPPPPHFPRRRFSAASSRSISRSSITVGLLAGSVAGTARFGLGSCAFSGGAADADAVRFTVSTTRHSPHCTTGSSLSHSEIANHKLTFVRLTASCIFASSPQLGQRPRNVFPLRTSFSLPSRRTGIPNTGRACHEASPRSIRSNHSRT